MSEHRFKSHLVNGCTSLNLSLGIGSILLSSQGHLQASALCLLGGVVADAADGLLARRWSVASEFGAQMDSLADMTSFVVGGAALTFQWFRPALPLWAAAVLAIWFALHGAWRLARFNVGPRLKDEFCGMPTTAMATLLSACLLASPELPGWGGWVWFGLPSWLMCSALPYPKFTRVTELPLWFFACLPVAALVHLPAAVWACSVLYVASGPLILWRRRGATAQGALAAP